MNKVILTGRLAKDPILNKVGDNISVVQFSLAVDKRFKKDPDEKPYFFNCVAWRNQAEFLSKYCHQGDKIMVEGYLTSRNWQDPSTGQTKYATEVYVENLEFLRAKGDGSQSVRNINNLDIPQERTNIGTSFNSNRNIEDDSSDDTYEDIFTKIQNNISENDLP